MRTLVMCSAPLCRSEAKFGEFCRAHAPIAAIRQLNGHSYTDKDVVRPLDVDEHDSDLLMLDAPLAEDAEELDLQAQVGAEAEVEPPPLLPLKTHGHGVARWTRERAIQAAEMWATRHGRPPKQTDATGDPTLPNVSTLRTLGMSWADLIEAAGFPRPRRGRGRRPLSEAHRQAIRDGHQRARENHVAPILEPALRVSNGFVLPLDVAGEAIAILAKRGAGKTNAGRVLVEELVKTDVHVVVIDPVGAWWGLRSSADGVGDGLPLTILGGSHGDAPLPTFAGRALAELVVTDSRSLILDLSDMTKDEQRSFVADFAAELYQRKARTRDLIHVVLEEADEFAPQRARAGGSAEETSRMRGAIETLVRRGRSRGIGLTMITQRSAGLSKDVLTQADVLIAMRTTGPTDVKAIREWVAHNTDQSDDVVASLPGLKTGEAWVWNPERELLARVQIRLAWTFNSSATPKHGETHAEPEQMAAVAIDGDLEQALGQLVIEAPEPEIDYRDLDEDGRYGCKVPGCEGRSTLRAGPYAYLCDDEHTPGGGQRETPTEVEAAAAKLVKPPPAEVAPPEHAPEEVRLPFGLTGDFTGDAQRVRDEAARIRWRAVALDRIAEGLEMLAEGPT